MDVDQDPRKRLYFADGRRKVDYVLVYHNRKRSFVRGSPSQHRLSTISNGSYPLGVEGKDPVGGKDEPLEVVVDVGPLDPADGEKIMIREEFEGNLKDAGLEIERDKEVCGSLIDFICGVQWNIPCKYMPSFENELFLL